MTRIVDVRLVLDRDDRVRVHVEGRLLGVTFDSPRAALSSLAAAIPPVAAAEQLAALALERPHIEPRERAPLQIERRFPIHYPRGGEGTR